MLEGMYWNVCRMKTKAKFWLQDNRAFNLNYYFWKQKKMTSSDIMKSWKVELISSKRESRLSTFRWFAATAWVARLDWQVQAQSQLKTSPIHSKMIPKVNLAINPWPDLILLAALFCCDHTSYYPSFTDCTQEWIAHRQLLISESLRYYK